MFSIYDFMSCTELKNLYRKRYGYNKMGRGNKAPMTMNQSAHKYRLFFIAEDIKAGLNPYLNPSHNNSSPSNDDSPLQQ